MHTASRIGVHLQTMSTLPSHHQSTLQPTKRADADTSGSGASLGEIHGQGSAETPFTDPHRATKAAGARQEAAGANPKQTHRRSAAGPCPGFQEGGNSPDAQAGSAAGERRTLLGIKTLLRQALHRPIQQRRGGV